MWPFKKKKQIVAPRYQYTIEECKERRKMLMGAGHMTGVVGFGGSLAGLPAKYFKKVK